MTKTRERRRLWINRETAAALLLLLGLALLGLGLTEAELGDKFLPGTTVCGVSCATLSAAETEALLRETAETKTVTLTDGEALLTLPLSAFIDDAALTAEVEARLQEQIDSRGAFAWLKGKKYDCDAAVFGAPKAADLRQLIDEALYGATEPVKPQDAYIALEADSWRLVPEITGNTVNTGRCARALRDFLSAGGALLGGERTSFTLEVAGARALPGITTENADIQAGLAALEAEFSLPVTVDFENGNAIALSPEQQYRLYDVALAGGALRAELRQDRVLAFAKELAAEYGSDGIEAKFRHVERETQYYPEGDWGYTMDRDRLGEELYAALLDRQEAVVTPKYEYVSFLRRQYGVGSTVLEISIENQYMWYYLWGELIAETPVTTGCVSTGSITRRGVFEIVWKTADTYLRGADYCYHVDYWMPFDDQIGLHDSSWRTEYGGDYYLTDGSHGCVNTPLEAIATIFDNIWVGVSVVVY